MPNANRVFPHADARQIGQTALSEPSVESVLLATDKANYLGRAEFLLFWHCFADLLGRDGTDCMPSDNYS